MVEASPASDAQRGSLQVVCHVLSLCTAKSCTSLLVRGYFLFIKTTDPELLCPSGGVDVHYIMDADALAHCTDMSPLSKAYLHLPGSCCRARHTALTFSFPATAPCRRREGRHERTATTRRSVSTASQCPRARPTGKRLHVRSWPRLKPV